MPASPSVLVTRPSPQGEALCTRLTAAGFPAQHLPTLRIEPVPALALDTLDALARADWVIFISRNAVEHALALLGERQHLLLKGAALAAVGPATAQALRQHGLTVACSPGDGYTSEALLAQPELRRLEHAEVVIVRGVGGRELLAQTLRGRGARVRYAEVYRRALPPAAPAQALSAWLAAARRILIITSREGLDNLLALAPPKALSAVRSAAVIVVSERLQALARTLGFDAVHVARGPDDQALLSAVRAAWQDEQHQDTR